MDDINKRLQSIEERLTRIESELRQSAGPIRQGTDYAEEQAQEDFRIIRESPDLESSIGRYGLAGLGNFVLLLGIIFLTQWVISLGKPLVASLIGFAASGGLIAMHYSLKKSNANLAFLFRIVGFFLVWYFTLRLHYFTGEPVVGNEYIGFFLVSIIVILQLFLGIREGSEFFTILAVLMGYFTALAGNTSPVLLVMIVILAGIALYLQVRSGWRVNFILSMLTGYLVYLLWILNNPIVGNPIQVIAEHHYGYVSLFATAMVFALIPLFSSRISMKKEFLVASLWLNSLGFSFILLLMVLQFFTENFAGLFIVVSFLCLGYAFILMVREDWKFGSAFYALYAFLALSISFYGWFGFPKSFMYLAVESLLVVTVALWFRNKLIVIMNGVLFTLLLIAYYASPHHQDPINIAYAIVPLATARVLNWKKQRLEIKTDVMRNLYLITGFVAVLYALYELIPTKYVSLSWTIAAAMYFLLSFILRNVKYRYMGIATVIAAAIYLILVDLARIEIAYRVIAFLFLALISIGVSVFYSRRLPNREESSEE